MSRSSRREWARRKAAELAARERQEKIDSVDSMPEPTDEQLENLLLGLGLPLLPESLRPSYYRQSLLNLHRITQKAAYGDEESARALEALKRAFGNRPGAE